MNNNIREKVQTLSRLASAEQLQWAENEVRRLEQEWQNSKLPSGNTTAFLDRGRIENACAVGLWPVRAVAAAECSTTSKLSTIVSAYTAVWAIAHQHREMAMLPY